MKLPLKPTALKILVAIISLALLIIPACSPSTTPEKSLREITTGPLTLTVAHVSDTHTYVTPYDYMLKINGRDTLALLGGYSLLMTEVVDIRNQEKNLLLLHAGDILEGTIWTPAFSGLADCDCLNAMKFDALVLGNHDFARGAAEAAGLVKQLKFPVLAANLDVSAEPSLVGKIMPYRVVEMEGQKVGIIGLITPDTTWMNRPGSTVIFHNPEESARRYIAMLNEEGINKIIVLSHLGYPADVKLAQSVGGIDVIIGGHTHTFMGGPEFEALGLHPQMPYPTELSGPLGDRVLVAHSWEYNRLLGILKLHFDDKGRIIGFYGRPTLYATDRFKLEESWGWGSLCSCRPEYGQIMQAVDNNTAFKIVYEHPEINRALQPYYSDMPENITAQVAVADENLYRGLNRGPGPVIADAFLWDAQKINSAARFALYASYNVRNDIYEGEVTLEDINMLVPLRQELATVTASGSLVKLLIEMVYDGYIKAGVPTPYLETSGLHLIADMSRRNGERIISLQVINQDGEYENINPEVEYTLVTTDLQVENAAQEIVGRLPLPPPARDRAAGWIKNYLKFSSLGIKDVDAVADYCRLQKNLRNITEPRTTIIPAPAAAK